MTKPSEKELLDWLMNELNLSENEVKTQKQLYSNGIISSFTIVKLIRFIETKINSRVCEENLALENFESFDSILNKVLAK
ncbi:MAG: hypothetical protein H6625_05680 [Bdellovibrionaceae bacterium]|nr:hypothetical protein [Pseudobdellovibrionaceae bacterium]